MIISKAELISNINSEISDNSKGDITPFDIRHNFLDLIDSVHNLTEFNNLRSKNFNTEQGSRTTRIGEATLDNFRKNIQGYNSVDNTVVGYAALNKNYQGYANTAVGSFALNCNIHGHNNVAVGFNSAAAGTTGYGNVSIGSYALHNNKIGNLNIAIGHGAGYYVNRDTSSKLFISSHNVDTDYICSNEQGVGLIPLIEGDLDSANLRLGIAVTGLHEGATLQVGGSIHPTQTSNYSYDLGSDTYRFRDIYLSNNLFFAENNYIKYNTVDNNFVITSPLKLDGYIDVSGTLTVENNAVIKSTLEVSDKATIGGSLDVDGYIKPSGDITPVNDLQYRLGLPDKTWLSADIYNLNIYGKSVFNKFEAVEQSHYLHKTIFLASSGYIDTLDGGGPKSLTQNYHPNDNIEPPVGYLKDEDLFGAGLNINSRDPAAGYNRTYSFTYRHPDQTLSFLSRDDAFSRSHWTSNISIETTDGNHVKTDRVINKSKLGLLNYNSGFGAFIESDTIDIGVETLINKSNPNYGDINYFSNPSSDNYRISLISSNNRTNIHQKFATTSSSFELSFLNKEPLDAPEFFNPEAGQSYDRFVIKGNKNSSSRSFIMMNHGNKGFVGINDFPRGEYLIPDTILNIRATGDAILRVAAENIAQTRAGIQLLTTSNCLDYGLDLYYDNSSKTLNGDLYHVGESTKLIKADFENKFLGIFVDNADLNSMITVGSQLNPNAAISMSESANFASATERYGKIFVRKVEKDAQSSTLSYVDGDGNYFDFSLSAITAEGGGLPLDIYAFADSKRNTMVGNDSPRSRNNISTANDNTALGYAAFSGIFTGDRNTCIGSNAGANLSGASNDNIIIGAGSGPSSLANSNTIIGNQITSTIFSPSTSTSTSSNKLLIDNVFECHKNSSRTLNGINNEFNDIYLHNSKLNISYGIDNSIPQYQISIDAIDGRISYNKNSLKATVNDYTVINIDRGNDSLTPSFGSSNYRSSSSPYLEINGDLRIKGNILWSDGTKIDSGQIQDDVQNLQSETASLSQRINVEQERINTLNADLDSFITEGYSDGTILPPENANSPTFGNVTTKIKSGNSWINGPKIQIVNRDKFMRISRGDFVVVIKVNGEYRPIFVSYGS